MFDISNNGIITITRGDSAVTNLYINLGTECCPDIFDINQWPHAKVYLGITEPHMPFEQALVRKVFDIKDFDESGKVLKIKFKTEDTENLVPGLYYYSVKLLRMDPEKNGEDLVDTVISKKKFIILD